MIQETTIIIKPEEENKTSLIELKLRRALFDKGIKVTKEDTLKFIILKKSMDARHGRQKLVLRCKAFINQEPESQSAAQKVPEWKKADPSKTVIIVGSGPAGLFAALCLLEAGIKPVIIERGKDTSNRKRDIAAISRQDKVDPDSNYCFGEGGAGTFSDGKLYTRSNKRGDIGRILTILNAFGADPKILTDAHPHIGTDKLPAIINSIRAKIIELGGEFHFQTKCTGFLTTKSAASLTLTGISTVNTDTGESKNFMASKVILATGHSATDIYYTIAKAAPQALQAKTFAAGVRVEHPRQLIDAIQYRGKKTTGILPTAEYRLTAQADGRGVYSFCMCPGGFVVPSSSGPDEIVVNGMSAAKRNSRWSNAAIVVEIRPEDIDRKFTEQAAKLGCPDLAGLEFRTWLERLTKQNGNGQAAPAQRLNDFLDHKDSKDLPDSSYTPGLVPSRLDKWLPSHITSRLEKGFREFNRNHMRGFVCPDALLIASETRTSTPVRILRDKESLESPVIKGLYPCGEGSGYSGGIVSSAMDGENTASQIIKSL
ncbi:MAG: FAD-dependent monooxygenase [Treponema sp.]|nr:FAD-dependent monooxygenase [Treponema sp.]